MTHNSPSPLPDAKARDDIVTRLDANFAVEAAAGSGKTTCLVGRILALCEQGHINPTSLMAAVTFTRKAAAELRDRLQLGIRDKLSAAAGAAFANLTVAEKSLKQCHIGTIHSFCARLLRERPVEAGVDPEFRELEDDEDTELRDRAWTEFSARFYGEENAQLEQAVIDLDLSLEDLRPGFHDFARYPDVEDWPGEDHPRTPNGAAELYRALLAYAPTVRQFVEDPDMKTGRDQLLPTYRAISRWAERQKDTDGADEIKGIFQQLPKEPYVVQKQWACLFGGECKIKLEEEVNRYSRFYSDHVLPYRTSLLAARYAVALSCFRQASLIHNRLRRDNRVLNFGDLLMKTAALLRNHPWVRTELSERYCRILVDEVQDTDPIQAEILFLLAGENSEEPDWRKSRPRPGSLFIVGDPKQSIYRFTRADIATYSLIKRLIEQNGGETLSLSVNFRSQPDVIGWVNRIFVPDGSNTEARFPDNESEFCPVYVPLQPGGEAAHSQCFSGVYLLKTLAEKKAEGISGRQIEEDEAKRIAAFIKHALDTGMPIHNPKGDPRPAKAEDFLILTEKTKGSGGIAAALRRAGLPVRISGGSGNTGQNAPGLLLLLLEALLDPDNPILQVACLRSRLFGVPDPELYSWKKGGGAFVLHMPNQPDEPGHVAQSLAMLRRLERLFHDHDPVTALGLLADTIGIWALAATGENADADTAALLTLFDRLTMLRKELPTPGSLLRKARAILSSKNFDAVPALGENTSVVRVMNLHKAKGLEAPVVFLAAPSGRNTKPVKLAIKRTAGHTVEGRLALYRAYGKSESLVACPADWQEAEAREKQFLRAEKLRLSYVAATRAGSAVVISARPTGKGLKNPMIDIIDIDQALPEAEEDETPRQASIEASSQADLPTIDVSRLDAAARREKIDATLVPTYMLERAKTRKAGVTVLQAEEAMAEVAADEDMVYRLRQGTETALALGEAMHEILENDSAMPDGELIKLAKAKLAEHELQPNLADDIVAMAKAVWQSDLWRRANQAKRVFRELPFTMAATTADGLPALVRGVIDLAFEEADGWVVADYKTDKIRGTDLQLLAGHHRGQLETYAEALMRISPDVNVKELGIYFLRAGEYIVLPMDSDSTK